MMDEIRILSVHNSYESAASVYLILKAILSEDVNFYFEVKQAYLTENYVIVCNHKVIELIKTTPMPKVEDFS